MHFRRHLISGPCKWMLRAPCDLAPLETKLLVPQVHSWESRKHLISKHLILGSAALVSFLAQACSFELEASLKHSLQGSGSRSQLILGPRSKFSFQFWAPNPSSHIILGPRSKFRAQELRARTSILSAAKWGLHSSCGPT